MAELHGDTTRVSAPTPRVDVNTTTLAPTDRIRWGPIIGGLFAALSALALLSVLGLAVGLSSVDANDQASNFGIGAGIWGGVTALLAFFFGGWIAARTAAVRGESNGLLQGAMVWMVAIPLLLYLLVGGIGSMIRTTGNVAASGLEAVPGMVDNTGNDANLASAREEAGETARQASESIQATAQDLRQEITPQRVENVANKAGGAAWGTLASMLLGLGAASLGGYIGSGGTNTRRQSRD